MKKSVRDYKKNVNDVVNSITIDYDYKDEFKRKKKPNRMLTSMLSSLDVVKHANKAMVEEKTIDAEVKGPLVPDILRDSTDDYLKKLSNEIALNQAFI